MRVGSLGVALPVLAGLVASLPITRLALADSGLPPGRDPVAAEALFEAAKQQLKAGDWQSACAKFQASMALDASVSTQVKLAQCREHEGKLAAAWYQYRRALELNRESESSERRKRELDGFISGEIDKLAPRLPKLSVSVTPVPAGVEVTRDGQITSLDEAVPVDPGEHAIVGRAPGYREQRRTISVSEGQHLEVALVLVPEQPIVVAAPAQPAPPRAAPGVSESKPGPALPDVSGGAPVEPARVQRELGFALSGAGVIAFGATVGFAWQTSALVKRSNPECVSDQCSSGGVALRSSAREEQALAITSGVMGALMLGSGIVLIALAPPRQATAFGAPLEVLAGPGSVTARGSF